MENKQKWRKESWFKPTIIVIGIVLVIVVVKLAVNNPFKDLFKRFNEKTEQTTYDMETIITDSDPYLGDRDAKVKLVEFGDFNCPFCRAAYPALRELSLEYEDDLFFQFRDFPVVSPQSIWLAEAANCADEQNKFWPFHDLLYQRQGQITESNIYSLAQGTGIEINKFKTCLQSERFKNEVAEDYLAGENLNIKGTPTFFINGLRFEGVPEKENLKKIIDRLIFIEDNL